MTGAIAQIMTYTNTLNNNSYYLLYKADILIGVSNTYYYYLSDLISVT